MAMYLQKDGIKTELSYKEGQNVLEVLREHGIEITAPCGGGGRCGKCRIIAQNAGELSENEKAILSKTDVENGVRLACCVKASDGIVISPEGGQGEARILVDGNLGQLKLDPSVRVRHLYMEAPTAHDQRPDTQRVFDTLSVKVPFSKMNALPGALREGGFDLYVTDFAGEMMELCKDEPEALGAAIDIGTTTVAAYLYDLKSGERIGVGASLNAQRTFGADVITRSDAASTDEGKAQLPKLIREQVVSMVSDICIKNGKSINSVRHITIVGNTIMAHLFLGLPTENITKAPFIPVNCEEVTVNASELSMRLENCKVTVLPCVAGYVGADTVAAVIACNMDKTEDITLLIDIGTNGEIVLGKKGNMICCSAAAGPAFEGAHIECGMGGVEGAISKVWLKDGEVKFKTIGDVSPKGLCGSGLVDACALLIREGVVDETGYMDEESELISENDEGDPVFMIGGGVYLSQKDIRQIQLAKGAIMAGVMSLVKEYGCDVSDIKRICLAGGFGNYISVDSACDIGLLPAKKRDVIGPVGNAAGVGALIALMDKTALEDAGSAALSMRYIELSTYPAFQDLFVENMLFEAEE
ncbi:MAG: DUF4445 domain-containing protein [Clostridia bacterium]|nr:DUF4445 domain-containing protein [Clostridia bacterium]